MLVKRVNSDRIAFLAAKDKGEGLKWQLRPCGLEAF